MLKNTQSLFIFLEGLNRRKEIVDTIDNELTEMITYFSSKGHDVDKISFFKSMQALSEEDIFVFLYFRDLYFIYWGLKDEWKDIQKLDKLYYPSLKSKLEKLYASKND